MSFPEYQMPGVRTARGAGEPYSYFVPFTQAQLVTMIPGLNVFPKLPAGSIVKINGLLYRTLMPLDAGTPGPQIGAIVPLGPPRPSVIGPKKTGDTFVDRASVYWDIVNNYFTSTSSGTTFFAGYAVSNPQLGSGTNGTSSTLTITPSSDATEYNAVATITGGTSADGQVGAYAAADTSIEVELFTASTVNVTQTSGLNNVITAPATGHAISAAATGHCALVIGSTNDLYALPPPTFNGQSVLLDVASIISSTTGTPKATVAIGSTYGGSPVAFDATHKHVEFTAAGQAAKFLGIPSSTSAYKWMLDGYLGTTLST